MPAGHLLAYIKKDGISSVLGDVNRSLEVMGTSCLPPVTLCRGHVQGHFLTFCLSPFHFHALVCRIEISQTVIVPEKAVTLAGKDERY